MHRKKQCSTDTTEQCSFLCMEEGILLRTLPFDWRELSGTRKNHPPFLANQLTPDGIVTSPFTPAYWTQYTLKITTRQWHHVKTAAILTENERHFWSRFLSNIWPMHRRYWWLFGWWKECLAYWFFVTRLSNSAAVSWCKSNCYIFCSNSSIGKVTRQQRRWLWNYWNVSAFDTQNCILQQM